MPGHHHAMPAGHRRAVMSTATARWRPVRWRPAHHRRCRPFSPPGLHLRAPRTWSADAAAQCACCRATACSRRRSHSHPRRPRHRQPHLHRPLPSLLVARLLPGHRRYLQGAHPVLPWPAVAVHPPAGR
eukprot:365428-Chlamydomonas_euryale.AAC.16